MLIYFRRNYSHVEKTMSARSQRGTHDTPTTKRFRSPRITVRNRTAKPQITYDYDAAISQPDVPNLLDYKNIGRGVMVSGVPLRKKALKTRLKGRIISRKNFQKRSQEIKTKSLIQKNASPIKTHTRSPSRINQKTMASSSIFEKENYIGEKENITNNDTNNVEHLSNSLRKNLVVDAKNISYKDTKEAIENDNNNQMTQQMKNETSEDYEIAKKKSAVQVKGSKIPRAKIAVFPVHTFYELHSFGTKRKLRR
ncbi:uncharacterized protein LOC105680219 isoform X1 [Bombus impatiens]|uniref:Uncharacterized protein LOC105680219 isoform X1 n=1 Tax=Bombus impatiens TaxID=132113 RepID=A0A6P8L0T8_BOMIM|nr:uncharacterized protein LOC105680219 isoform X1 [Bombus impatiens]